MIHKNLAGGKWFTMLFFDSAFDRALELIDSTLANPRWQKGIKKVARIREILCDIDFGQNQYDTSLESLDDYFFWFELEAKSGA